MRTPKQQKLMDALNFLEDRVDLKHTQGSIRDAIASVRTAIKEAFEEKESNGKEA